MFSHSELHLAVLPKHKRRDLQNFSKPSKNYQYSETPYLHLSTKPFVNRYSTKITKSIATK